MRTIKLKPDQFRTYRLNTPPTPENPLGSRGLLKQQLLEQNAGYSFRLMSPMGRFIGTVRGQNSEVGSAPMGTPTGVPHPDSCVCKAYAGTRPGEHHDVCQFRQAWENGKGLTVTQPTTTGNLNPAMNVTTQRVAPPIDTTPRVQHMQVPAQASSAPRAMPTTLPAVRSQHDGQFIDPSRAGGTATPSGPALVPASVAMPGVAVPTVQVPAVVALISPEQCDCRQFAKPTGADPKQHHFVCQNYEKWKIAHPTSAPVQMVPSSDGSHGAPIGTPLSVGGELAEPEVSDTEPPPPDTADYVLVDLDSQSVLRDATSDEVALAREEEEKNGSPIVKVDDALYAVIERPVQSSAVQS